MRHRLNTNKNLRTPPSFAWAQVRHGQLLHEVEKCERQLEPEHLTLRAAKFPTMVEFDRWHTSAQSALRHLKRELDLLTLWLAEREPDGVVLKVAWGLLEVLADEVDLEREELAIVERVRKHMEG